MMELTQDQYVTKHEMDGMATKNKDDPFLPFGEKRREDDKIAPETTQDKTDVDEHLTATYWG